MTGQVEGKRALIYGGGTGLGLACAEAMLDAGASIFITGRRMDKLAAARDTMARLRPHRRSQPATSPTKLTLLGHRSGAWSSSAASTRSS